MAHLSPPTDATFGIDTPFSHMPIGRRNRWIAWANSHDWGAGERPAHFIADSGALRCYGIEHDGTDWHVISADHLTPRAMRDWAGY